MLPIVYGRPGITIGSPTEYCRNVVPVPTTVFAPFVTATVPGPVVIGMRLSVTPETPDSLPPMRPFLSASLHIFPLHARVETTGTWNAQSRSRTLAAAVTVAPSCAPGEVAALSGRP